MRFEICSLCLLVHAIAVNAQGVFSTKRGEFPRYIYQAADPCDPATTTSIVSGDGYSGEIAYSLMPYATRDELLPLKGTLSHFTTTGESIRFPLLVSVPGTVAGDRITLTVRVWENRGDTIRSWAAAMTNPDIAKGESNLMQDFQLSGVTPDGVPIVGANLNSRLGSFLISAVCPEPPTYLLLGIAGGICWLMKPWRRSDAFKLSPRSPPT